MPPNSEPPNEELLLEVRNLRKVCNSLYQKGVLNGLYSDVKIHALDKIYTMHRVVLLQSPYFESMFQGKWLESKQQEIKLKFDDPNVNAEGLETISY